MKLRILRKPSLMGNPNVFWYHAQVRRFGIWIDCHQDPLMTLNYSMEMLAHSHDTELERVEKFVDFVIHKQEMYPHKENVVIQEYEA
jgi:hypothetical protein